MLNNLIATMIETWFGFFHDVFSNAMYDLRVYGISFWLVLFIPIVILFVFYKLIDIVGGKTWHFILFVLIALVIEYLSNVGLLFGVLPEYLKYARSALIGKSLLEKFDKDGGQNPILAAQMGCKIYHGPNISNFDDIYMFLKDKNLSQEISTIHNLSDNLIKDLKTKKNLDQSKDLFDKIGETIMEKTFKEIDNFLNYENL